MPPLQAKYSSHARCSPGYNPGMQPKSWEFALWPIYRHDSCTAYEPLKSELRINSLFDLIWTHDKPTWEGILKGILFIYNLFRLEFRHYRYII